VHLLGHSSGARYALHAALLVPDCLRGLVLYEPPPEVMERFEGLVETGDRDGILATFYEDLSGVPPAVVEEMRDTPGWRMAAENALTFVPEARSLAGYSFDPASLAALRVPVLLLLGGESPPLFREEVVMVAAALPDARIATLPGQGHEAMLTAPGLFAREVTRFLAQR
jgi:pimeloyl-ACP methyl ester carboxylesterase